MRFDKEKQARGEQIYNGDKVIEWHAPDGNITFEELLIAANITAERAATAVAVATQELASAQLTMTELQQTRETILLSGTAEDLFKRDQDIARQRAAIERLETLMPRLVDKTGRLQAEEQEAALLAAYNDVSGECRDFEARFTRFHDEWIAKVSEMHREFEEHTARVKQVNANLPEGATPLRSGYSAARDERGLITEARVESLPGWVPTSTGNASHVQVPDMHKREVMVEVQQAFWPEPYFKQIRIPHLKHHGFAIGGD